MKACLLLLAVSALLAACTSTELEVSPHNPANPQAPGAPLPGAARSLRADFDPLEQGASVPGSRPAAAPGAHHAH